MDTIYDVISVEDGRVSSITVWKNCELQRAIRLAKRENSKTIHQDYGIIISGTYHTGVQVVSEMKKFVIPCEIVIDGKRIKQKDIELIAMCFITKN